MGSQQIFRGYILESQRNKSLYGDLDEHYPRFHRQPTAFVYMLPSGAM